MSVRGTVLTLIAIASLSAPFLAAAGEPLPIERTTAAVVSGDNALMETISFSTGYPLRHAEDARKLAAREYLSARLVAYGYEVTLHGYGAGKNVVGVLPGTVRPDEWIVVSAHYDTVSTTEFGTWDDGAGVGTALEIARVAATASWARSFAVVFFDDEEQGLVGSEAFVADYEGKSWKGTTIRLVADIEMDPPGLNWPCVAGSYETQVVMPFSFYQHSGGGTGAALLKGYARSAALAAGVPPSAIQDVSRIAIAGPLVGSSDNAEFARAGIPDLWVGGTTHMGLSGLYALTYPLHTPADNPATLLARCPGIDPATGRLLIAEGFEVAGRVVYQTARSVDAYPHVFPRP